MGDILQGDVQPTSSGLTLGVGHGCKEFVPNLNNQRKTGKFCDITLKVGGKSFPAHKNILVGFSPFFASRISEDPVKSEFEIEGTKPEIFEIILNYGYLADVFVTDDNVVPVLRAASRLEVTSLSAACGEYWGKTANEDNYVGLYELATEVSCPTLAESVNKYVKENFSVVSNQMTFLDLKPEQLIDTIKSDDLEVKTEDVVFDAVMRWVNHVKEREPLLPKILVYVRLAFLSPEFLRKRVQEEEAIKNSPLCMQWISEILLSKLHLGLTEPLQSFTKPRSASGDLEALLVLGQTKEGNKTMLGYSIELNEVFTLEVSRILDFQNMASAADGNTVYLLGSWDNYYSLCRYDSVLDNWVTIVDSVPRWHSMSGIVCLEGFVYATTTNTSEVAPGMRRFDTKTNAWAPVADMPVPLWDCSLVVLEGFIYAIGGFTINDKGTMTYSYAVQRYDPRSNTWLERQSLPSEHFSGGSSGRLLCCAIGQTICVVDGTQNNKSGKITKVLRYTLSPNKWEIAPQLHQAYMNPAALVVLNGRMTFIDTSRFPYLQIEQLAADKNAWEIYENEVKLGDLINRNVHFVRDPAKIRLP